MRSNGFAIIIASLFIAACTSHTTSPVVQAPTSSLFAPDTSPTPTWKAFGVYDVGQMVPGHDGNMWYIAIHGGYGRITPTGGSQSSLFPDATQIGYAITPNPDGNVYIGTSNNSTCHVYQVHPDLTARDLITPFACSGGWPEAMTSGYDQRVWIVDGVTPNITRITTAGEVSTLTMPQPVGFITRGSPTGRAMFTEFLTTSEGTVYRIAPDDSITSVTMAGGMFLNRASDGNIYGAAASFSDLNRPFYRLDDKLNLTTYVFKRVTSFPFATLEHKKIFYMPMNIYPRNGQIFRFNTATEAFMVPWNFIPNLLYANIGPDHNLWLSNGLNVSVIIFS